MRPKNRQSIKLSVKRTKREMTLWIERTWKTLLFTETRDKTSFAVKAEFAATNLADFFLL